LLAPPSKAPGHRGEACGANAARAFRVLEAAREFNGLLAPGKMRVEAAWQFG
jgi:hypothetical protein